VAPELIAYHLSGRRRLELEPAPVARDWMAGDGNQARRCLPMLIANQSGWLIRNPYAFRAIWDGGDSATATSVEPLEDVRGPEAVLSDFGFGIVTWLVPYVFRTPPGWNLLARGPANWPRDGASPLEGVVETDWTSATFTMNWKLTRPGQPVTFDAGEPFCMVVPQRRGELEAFDPQVRDVADEPEVEAGFEAFKRSRHEHQARQFAALFARGTEKMRGDWQRHYFKGAGADGRAAPPGEHQTKLRLGRFRDAEG
jgi:hypothetical protein